MTRGFGPTLGLSILGVAWFILAHSIVQAYLRRCDASGPGSLPGALFSIVVGVTGCIVAVRIFVLIIRRFRESALAVQLAVLAGIAFIVLIATWGYVMFATNNIIDPVLYEVNCGTSRPGWWPGFLPAPYPQGFGTRS